MHQLQGAGGTGKVPAILFKNGTASTNETIGGWTAYNTSNQVAYVLAAEESANDDAYIKFATRATGGSIGERLRIHSDGQVTIGNDHTGAGTWDTNGDGFYDASGSTITVSWTEPAEISIGLRAVSQDGRSATVYLNTTIQDISPPDVSLSASDIIRKDFDDELLLTANIDDNWGIYSVEWLVDETVIQNYSTWNWQDGKTFTFRFDSSYLAGNHDVTIRVTDNEGQVTERTAIIDLYDSTPPLVPQQTVETVSYTHLTLPTKRIV